jgi:hypothetical protein
MVIAATFSNATYERLPLEDTEDDDAGQHGNIQPDSPPKMENSRQQIGQQMPGPSSLPINYNNLQPNLLQNGVHLGHEAYAWAHARPPF